MINSKDYDDSNVKNETPSAFIPPSKDEIAAPLKRKANISPKNDEEDEDRIKHSRERNRISAKKSRQRKKFFIESLIKKNEELEEENRNLRALLYQQKQLYDQVNNISNIFNPSSYNGMNQFMLSNSSSANTNALNANDNNVNINEKINPSLVNEYINQLNQVMQRQQQQQPEPPPTLQLQEQQLLSINPSTSSASTALQLQQNQNQIQQQQQQQQPVLPIPVPSLHKTKTPSSTIQHLTMYKSTLMTPDIMQNKINNNNNNKSIHRTIPSSSLLLLNNNKQTTTTVANTNNNSGTKSTTTTTTIIQQQQQQIQQQILPPPLQPTQQQQQQLFSQNNIIYSELDYKFISEIKLTNLPFVILDCSDTTSPIIYSSQKLLEITGYKENELYMQHITLFHTIETDIQIATVVVNSLKYRREMCVCYRNKTKNKTSFWSHLYLVPVTNNNNEIINFVGIYNVVDDDVACALRDIQSVGLKSIGSGSEYVLPTITVDQMKASHPGYQMRKVFVFI